MDLQKKFFRPRIVWFVVFLLLPVAIPGCGRKDDAYSLGIDGHVYVAEQVELPEGAMEYKVRGGYLYWLEDRGNRFGIYRAPVEAAFERGTASTPSLSQGEELLPAGTVISSRQYEADGEGNLYYVDRDNLLVKRRPDGTEGYRVQPWDGREGISSLAAGDGGRLYVATDASIYTLDGEGNVEGQVSVGEYTRMEGFSGETHAMGYLLKGDDGGIYYRTDHSQMMKIEEESPGNLHLKAWEAPGKAWHRFLPSSQGMMYSGEDGTLYQYREREAAFEALLRWADSDLSENGLYGEILCLEEGKMAVYYDAASFMSGMYLLEKTPVEDLPEKETVVFAVFSPSSQMEQFVMQFNRNSDRYRVSMVYYQGEEGRARLDAQILSPDPPDLIELYDEDIAKYARKDALEDLSPYLETSAVLQREDFLEGILEAYTIRGRLVCIPREFWCDMVIGRSSQVGEEPGWTVEDVGELMDRHPGAELFADMGFPILVRDFFGNYILGQYIDWESGTCSFDGEEFAAFMEWVAAQSRETDQEFSMEPVVGTMPGDRLLAINASLLDLEALVKQEAFFQEAVTAIGYPTADGRACYKGNILDRVGILANSSRKEAAWEFIEAFLAWEDGRPMGLPSRKTALDKRMEELTTPDYVLDGEGNPQMDQNGNPLVIPRITLLGVGDGRVEVDYMTQEQADQVYQVIAATDFTPRDNIREEILDIIVEEISPCLTGRKTFQEAAEVVQNRVQNMVWENM